MFYVFCGDTEKIRKQAHAFVEECVKENFDTPAFSLSSDTARRGDFEELLFGQGLFQKQHVVIARNFLAHREWNEYLEKKIEAIAASPHTFVFIESTNTILHLAFFEKYATRVFQEYTKEKKGEFNIFLLAASFGARDRKQAWIFLNKARREGFSPEHIHGVLFWQVKNMILAKKAASPEDAGLKPFVFSKAARYAKNYTEDELRSLSSSLTSLFHEAHQGLYDLDLGLEKFLLRL